MIKCEKCLYRKNCQFLLTHKKTTVEACSAFESENDLKAETRKEFAERLKEKATDVGVCDAQGNNYGCATVVFVDDIDNLIKESGG